MSPVYALVVEVPLPLPAAEVATVHGLASHTAVGAAPPANCAHRLLRR